MCSTVEVTLDAALAEAGRLDEEVLALVELRDRVDAEPRPQASPGQQRPMDRRHHQRPRLRHPGCDRPAHWCQLHHLTHWANGGGTDLDNLALVCKKHHHLIHDDHWNLRHLDDDTWHLTRPNRTTVTPPRYPGDQRPPPGAVNALAVGPTERPVVHDGHLQRGHLPLVS